MIHVLAPYRSDKNLGKAYNDAMELIPDGEWAILHDHDVLFLLPDTITMIEEYTKKFPEAGILTCYCNRIGNSDQLLYPMSNNSDILHHINIAEDTKQNLFNATEISAPISGFLMVINKRVWQEVKFREGFPLGIDNDFSNRVAETGRKIYRMNSVYVFHTYRLKNGVKDKSHLR